MYCYFLPESGTLAEDGNEIYEYAHVKKKNKKKNERNMMRLGQLYRYGLTSTLELLLLVGQYYFSSVIHFTLMQLISIVCIMHTCQTDIRSENCKGPITRSN